MYQKIKKIENYALALLGINIILMLFLIVGLPITVLLVLLAIINTFFVYLIIKKGNILKDDIKKSKNLLPNSVIKAIDIDEYCMLMYDVDDNKIVWVNEYFNEKFGDMLDEDITKVFSGFFFDENKKDDYLEHDGRFYSVMKNEETFILKDVSDFVKISRCYENEKDCILFIRIDSIDDISSGMDEITYQNIIQKVRKTISDFTSRYDTILRRYKNDSYIVVVKQRDFNALIEESVNVLEAVKEANEGSDEHLTLSIGASRGFEFLKDTEEEAGHALDMALARGGDQIVVKEKDKEYKFYGNGSETVEKRNRVKVRMITSSLESLIVESSNIVIMPHKNADLDALGACYGLAKFASLNNKKALICSDPETLESNTKDAYYLLKLNEKDMLKNKDQIINEIDENTLLIVVDTSNIELFESQEIYEKIERRVIIDHHRRSHDFIKNPLLVYIEPYASSTVELVTELLNFQSKSFKLNSDVATLMLAGMMVDTSYFTVRTGVRTFEAAMFLKERGASPLEAKEILQVSRDTYQTKLAMVQNAIFIDDEIAISKYNDGPVTRSLLAQVAVELLEVKDIFATFVIAHLEDGSVGISARSTGDFNVQTILEKFGGGGHFSMAAAQLNMDIDLVEAKLIEELKMIKKG
ncbi:c-di-AMP phosphodiesterase-like protein [Bacilli bacterium PM5-3]|nr:c-di-AMP phosphodiesterase-like protein [Bacilli bacterium PM5-3]MDH6603378.1 c-di-AMP phosphodiesterase-like protein [Bacilli bacterium PM5-9]